MSTKPRTPTPDLEFETVGGDTWRLSDQKPENFTMIVAYRGLHCPICKNYLRELDRLQDDFRKRGVETVVFSTDDRARAEEAKKDWELENLTVGYGISIDKAREATAGSWTCSNEKMKSELGFKPQASLDERMREAASWYREKQLL